MPWRLLLRVALAATCVAGATVSAIVYVSEVRTLDSTAAFKRKDFRGGLAGLEASNSPLNPSAERTATIAGGLLHFGRPDEAERLLAAAARREPLNPDAWTALAAFQALRGPSHLSAAKASYARAVRLDPHRPPAF